MMPPKGWRSEAHHILTTLVGFAALTHPTIEEASIFVMTLLSRWRGRRRKADVAHLRVTVYTREQCCCCHKALDLLREYQGRHGFAIDEVDIDADPELAARYNTSVPVVAFGGKVRFKGVVNRVLLERLLAAERGGR